MPTPYDDFTPRAAQSFTDLPANALANRALLNDVMTEARLRPPPLGVVALRLPRMGTVRFVGCAVRLAAGGNAC